MAELTEPPAEEEPLTALDRVQTRTETPGVPHRPMWRPRTLVMIAVGVSVVAGLAWAFWPSTPGTDDVLVHLVQTTDSFIPDATTTDPAEARAMILDALGWDVAPPDLPALAIVGVGIPSIGTIPTSPGTSPMEVQVPAFRYEGGAGERAAVFAYDYILLDRVGQMFDLPEGTYAALSEPVPVDSRVVDGRFVVTWRQRAMIFSAVTSDEGVAERIRQSVSS
jgi:hypothetical protein